jgi:transcriptional regulator with XRE-family HTH domain
MYVYPTIDMQKTGSNIEALRKERGLSVKALQEYFGFENPQAIYHWQHGKSLPSVDNLLALSRILNITIEDILVEAEMSSPFFMTIYFKLPL